MTRPSLPRAAWTPYVWIALIAAGFGVAFSANRLTDLKDVGLPDNCDHVLNPTVVSSLLSTSSSIEPKLERGDDAVTCSWTLTPTENRQGRRARLTVTVENPGWFGEDAIDRVRARAGGNATVLPHVGEGEAIVVAAADRADRDVVRARVGARQGGYSYQVAFTADDGDLAMAQNVAELAARHVAGTGYLGG